MENAFSLGLKLLSPPVKKQCPQSFFKWGGLFTIGITQVTGLVGKSQELVSKANHHWGWCVFTEDNVLHKSEASSFLFCGVVRLLSGNYHPGSVGSAFLCMWQKAFFAQNLHMWESVLCGFKLLRPQVNKQCTRDIWQCWGSFVLGKPEA